MKAINCITFFLLITLKAQAQNVMTSSPYSMFGIGELDFTAKMQLWVVFLMGCEILR